MSEAEREKAAESARNNLLNNILGGIGYVAGRVGDFAKGIWDGMFGEEDGEFLAHGSDIAFDGKIVSGWLEGIQSKTLSAQDKAAFWEEWKTQSRDQTDATISILKSLGYDVSELENKVKALRAAKDGVPGGYDKDGFMYTNQEGAAIQVVGSREKSFLERVSSFFGFIANGINSAWNGLFGSSSLTENRFETAPVTILNNGARLPVGAEGSRYGMRTFIDQDGNEKTHFHTGLDQPIPAGTPIPAVADGKVVIVIEIYKNGIDQGYGAQVMIEHENGVRTNYGHNSAILVKVGDIVKQGQVISFSGNSGHSTGPHMHFEVRTYNEERKTWEFNDPRTFDWRR
ncbi:M23 family peptidase [Leptospira inadai serovar Lyme]|nr:M23 family peptidase [Leptospira inadai serovar Lyme]